MSKSPMMDAIEWLWMLHKTYRKAREFLARHVSSSRLVKSGNLAKDHPCYDGVIGVWNERNILLEIIQTVMEAAVPLANSLFDSNCNNQLAEAIEELARHDIYIADVHNYTAEHRTSQRITAVYNILVVVRDQLMAMFPMDQAPGEIIKKETGHGV